LPTNAADERLIVDYAFAMLAVIGSSTAAKPAQLFVAALGATNYAALRPPERRAWPTGSARTRAPSPSSAASRRWWCPTI
jgi:hypothetical protein